jgi:transposase-like protein
MPVTLHPLARTTPRTRAELQAEDPGLSHEVLARRYGISTLTVRKWRERDSTADRSHRPETPKRGQVHLRSFELG